MMTPRELQRILDELEASRSSRRRAWENPQEEPAQWLPLPANKTIDLEGRLIKDGASESDSGPAECPP